MKLNWGNSTVIMNQLLQKKTSKVEVTEATVRAVIDMSNERLYLIDVLV